MRTRLSARNPNYGPGPDYQARQFPRNPNDRLRGDALQSGLPPDIAPRGPSSNVEQSQIESRSSQVKTQPIIDHLKYGEPFNIGLSIGVADVLVLPRATELRVYLFIINTHATQTLFVNFGTEATPTEGVPIFPVGGFWEFDAWCPQSDIHLIGTGANTTGVLTFAERLPDAAKWQAIVEGLTKKNARMIFGPGPMPQPSPTPSGLPDNTFPPSPAQQIPSLPFTQQTSPVPVIRFNNPQPMRPAQSTGFKPDTNFSNRK